MNLGAINGNTFYHGSPATFQAFSYDFVGGDKANDQEGPGFYLTTSYEDAKRYSGPNGGVAKVSVKLSLVKDLILGAPNVDDTLTNWGETRSEAFNTAVNSIMTYNNGPHDAYQQLWMDFYHRAAGGDAAYLKTMVADGGYDGVIVPRSQCYHLIAFDPKKLYIIGWNV